MNNRSKDQWFSICKQITAGFTPGGEKTGTFTTAHVLVGWLEEAGLLQQGISILDLGCGNGRLAMGLVDGGWDIDYFGVDVVRPCIEFCENAFREWPRYHFGWMDVYNGRYWGQGRSMPEFVKLPCQDLSFDLVAAFSFFTHLANEVPARHYIREAWRVLKPGGVLFATWFIDPPFKLSNDPSRTVYPRLLVDDLYQGWQILTDGPVLKGTTQILVSARKKEIKEHG